MPKLARRLLIIDDIHNYLDHSDRQPALALRTRTARRRLGASTQRGLNGWRQIWTSDGFSDTAFWFKP